MASVFDLTYAQRLKRRQLFEMGEEVAIRIIQTRYADLGSSSSSNSSSSLSSNSLSSSSLSSSSLSSSSSSSNSSSSAGGLGIMIIENDFVVG